MKLGILGTADIAYRRFLPALMQIADITYAGVASRTPEKARKFQETYGGRIYDSYDALIADDDIDAVYVPLPPALHYEWGKKVLEAGKHLLMEKPFTTDVSHTMELLKLAEEKGVAVHENYMFLYHSQLARIKQLISRGELGKIRLYRMSFGFPMRGQGDFRYNKVLGGGALLDCGGYPVRLALELLGDTAKVVQSKLIQPKEFEVDLYGSAVMENDAGEVAQISFGMDNAYQCHLEIWGSKGTLSANRIFTAPPQLMPKAVLVKDEELELELPADDAFVNSIATFMSCIRDKTALKNESKMILKQADLISSFRKDF